MDRKDMIAAILNGDADEDLRSVMNACAHRESTIRANKAHLAFAGLSVGDRVRLVGGQQYLQGALGTVTEKNRTKVVVDLDIPHRRYFKGVVCPPDLLEKIA